ncbi:collagen-like protein [Aquimarina sp. RZ0]|uniref:collagen-like triple helix repeat-containing protein n=1 Tax=Aquimarina sp. RZ0 TaxID=2607730 RepID=UPI0011F2E024|nr:collagen-like protein [Aquimarina sp. RZ0]KAA1246410.1 collagen-like protein [Aquimarina sp. RZ0]
MKKIFTLLFLSTILFISCEGDQGPPGFDGRDGADGPPGPQGEDIVADVFEIENVNFVAPDFATRFTFPQNIFDSDVVLVYRLEDVVEDLDVWEPLPTATIFFEDGGFLQYRFNFTIGDVDIILESDDPTTLGAEFTTNQVFRIVVVPAAFVQAKNINLNDLNSVMSSLKLSKKDIIKISTE